METVTFQNIKEFSHSKTESLRGLKTNIQFCGDDVKVIMFTSSIPDEGKSTIAFDLAKSFTDSDKKVLLIDTDMRGSVMIGHLGARTGSGKKISGLSHYLSGQKKLQEVIYPTQINNLSIVFSGPTVPNPTEILENKYFDELIEYGRNHYDYILLDCAPIGAVIDAAVIAKHCDGAVMVVAQGVVGTRVIINAKKQLEAAGVRILGVVLNKVKTEKHHYGMYYGRYYGKYYGKYYGNYYGNYYDESVGGSGPKEKNKRKNQEVAEAI
jgi:capsular exopolysaccharide synthesis family protein